jgi:2-dehydropantoate 2-reductase
MRILVLGAGVIGSVYGGTLLQAGHEVVVLTRGARLADLRTHGLVLEDSESGERMELPVSAVDAPDANERFDLTLVPVRSDQLEETLPILTKMKDGSDVLFFGNTAGRSARLIEALGERALFGFPAAGGTRDGSVVKYVLIKQQKTMLGEPSGANSSRVRELKAVFSEAGFSVRITANIDGWLLGHAAFVVPIAFALYRVGVDPGRLANDQQALLLMVRATRQAFSALRGANAEIPTNVKILYTWMPETFALGYWRRVMASPRGELWFAGHSRAAREEMTSLSVDLLAAVHGTGQPTPDLDTLLSGE